MSYKQYIVRVYSDRTEWLNENGQLHRTNGPAVECANGNKEWYINGRLHRLDGPALDYSNGYRAWFINGQRHRTDDSAIEWGIGFKAWYLNGEKLTEEEFKRQTQKPSCEGKTVEIDGQKYKLILA